MSNPKGMPALLNFRSIRLTRAWDGHRGHLSCKIFTLRVGLGKTTLWLQEGKREHRKRYPMGGSGGTRMTFWSQRGHLSLTTLAVLTLVGSGAKGAPSLREGAV